MLAFLVIGDTTEIPNLTEREYSVFTCANKLDVESFDRVVLVTVLAPVMDSYIRRLSFEGSVIDVAGTEKNWVKVFDTIEVMVRGGSVDQRTIADIIQFPDKHRIESV